MINQSPLFLIQIIVNSIGLKPGRLVDPGLEPGWVEEKIGEEKTRLDLATRSKTWLRPVIFCFFY
jgi:hypothetical protein